MSGKKIVVLGTGGTIAGTSAQAGDNIGYTAAQVGIQQLLDAQPGLRAALGDAALAVEQVAQVDSKDMDCDIWRSLALRCSHHLRDPQVRAIIITHGTDTLEETAWFLHQVLDARKPVVLTCAMRPATALAPDGPQNLLDAMAVATAPGAAGVLAVAAGEVHGAQRVQKVHPYRVNAFNSGDCGPLGWVEEGRVRLVQGWPAAPAISGQAALEKVVATPHWPWVEVVVSHAGATGRQVDALVLQGVQGLVAACTGNGTIHHALEAALLRAQDRGVRVVRATRCLEGQILPKPGDAFPDSGGLSPAKARISLMLDLLA